MDFADPRGKLYDRTKFDFTVTRSHNFEAGEYSVVVRRADGAQVGTTQTLIFDGDNQVIDRRTMSFVGNGGKKATGDKPAAADDKSGSAPAAQGSQDQASATPAASSGEAPAAAGDGTAPADESSAAPDPAAVEKVPPKSGGCGCRLVAPKTATWPGAALVGLAFAVVGARARRRRSC